MVSKFESSPKAPSPYLPGQRNEFREWLARRKFTAAYSVWKRVIGRYVGEAGPERILEVGCGPGNFALCLENWFPEARLTALDLEDDLIHYASGRVRSAGFVRASSESLPLVSDCFDVVSALQVIEHFRTPENFLSEVRRVLRPGGIFLMSTPNTRGVGARLQGESWQGIREDHISLREPGEWQTALDAAGLERLSEGTTLFNGVPVVGRMPLSLPFQVLQSLAGWFPWSLGESYMVVARLAD